MVKNSKKWAGKKKAGLPAFNLNNGGAEGGILHTKSLENRLKSIITEINEEIDYWYYLLEPAYNRYLLSRE